MLLLFFLLLLLLLLGPIPAWPRQFATQPAAKIERFRSAVPSLRSSSVQFSFGAASSCCIYRIIISGFACIMYAEREREGGRRTSQQHHQQRRSEGGGRVPAPVAVPSGDIRQNSTTANGAKSNAFCVKLIIRLTWPPNARGERERKREIAKNKYRIMHDIYTYIVCMLYIHMQNGTARGLQAPRRLCSALLCLGHLFTCILRAGAE